MKSQFRNQNAETKREEWEKRRRTGAVQDLAEAGEPRGVHPMRAALRSALHAVAKGWEMVTEGFCDLLASGAYGVSWEKRQGTAAVQDLAEVGKPRKGYELSSDFVGSGVGTPFLKVRASTVPAGRLPAGAGGSPAPPFLRRRRQQGVALVITLILLSVITFMAVTFLVVSRRESEQVTTLSRQNNAKNAATIAADAAQSQVIALIQAGTNGYNFGLLVSTNFVSPFFDNSSPGSAGYKDITNVAYNYSTGFTNFSAADQGQMLNNLLVLPRAPVFFITNRTQTSSDFRFYLDLNRNGYYDPNNRLMILTNDSGNLVTNVYIGDPEWVGILDHPDMRHSSSNFFVGRYAFIALPIGNTLDFNFMHNHVKQLVTPPSDGFLRNQGVGSWEINMAGLLYGINSNDWTYSDYEFNNMGVRNSEFAFDDAAAILQLRYNGNLSNLRSFGLLYGSQAAGLIANGYIDYYSSGFPITANLAPLTNPPDSLSTVQNTSWSGDENPNQLFTTQDLFNSGLGQFPTRLQNMGMRTNSIDRYAFYNLLSQASFGSAPEPYPYPYHTRLNLNFSNVTASSVKVSISSTNFVGWNASQFFTNAVIRLLRSRPEFTNATVNLCSNGTIYIPVYPTNYYTPAVHRMLQLAANIYDASTNRLFDNVPNTNILYYPSVFRPTFFRVGTGASTIIYINGYTEVSNNVDFSQPFDLRRLVPDLRRFPIGASTNNVYGVPYVIGARSGLPHFNSFSMVPIVSVQRQMKIIKDAPSSTNSALWQTNVQYALGISNAQSVSCWYPMTNIAYSRGVRIYATNDMSIYLTITNNLGQGLIQSNNVLIGNLPNSVFPYALVSQYQWQGSPYLSNFYTRQQSAVNSKSFILPLANLTYAVTNSSLVQTPLRLVPTNQLTASLPFPTRTGYFVPKWNLTISNRVRLIMLDDATGRIIDYVQLGGLGQVPGLDSFEDINQDLVNADQRANIPPLWVTNVASAANPVPVGFQNQILVDSGRSTVPTSVWNQTQGEPQGFSAFLAGTITNVEWQLAFSASTAYTNTFTWSANDPLVHYTVGDLADLTQYALNTNNLWQSTNLCGIPATFGTNSLNFTNLMWVQRHVNIRRYQPWNVTMGINPRDHIIFTNQIAYQDPQIYSSSDWQFPAYKFPNIGWLGRVHRGTPWQTIYLKSTPVLEGTNGQMTLMRYANNVGVTNVFYNHPSWEIWTGDNNYWPGSTNGADAAMMEPTNDWKLLDLFTTSPNENASRGQLSINQSGQAAWMAVLDGVIYVTNRTTPTSSSFVGIPIDPYTNYTALTNLIASINNQRATYPNGAFTSVGDVLSTPQLTVASPFLNFANSGMLNDAAYEYLPQQILSLLRVGSPRYVIYAYGQSLKPADHSIIQSGAFFGMCTNYQITGEVVTRTVVRFEPTDPSVLGYSPAYTDGKGNPPTLRPVVESFAVLPPE